VGADLPELATWLPQRTWLTDAGVKQESKITDIDAYIASASPEVRNTLEQIRQVVRVAVPAATETISYRMPAFKLDRVFFYFAAFKQHIGVYPPVRGDRELQKELLPYRDDKGNLRFPLRESIP
jgi:uncharacterized protein YdhG (YjbR/CyaY superfamily)